MRFAALALLTGLSLSGMARAAEPDTYIFDALAVQPYKGNFARLVKGAPGWVKAIAAQGAGVAGPSRTVEVGGTPHRLDRVCKVGSTCASDRIDVLWGPRGDRVWAALVEGGKPPVMLGGPKGGEAAALAAATGEAPSSSAPPAHAAAATSPSPLPAAGSAAPAVPTPAAPSTGAAMPAAAESDPYIFDVLALQPYKGNFARLVKGAPDWVKAIAVQGAGAAGPSRTVEVGGTPYRLDRVCKVGVACATDRIDVLWGPRGARVWAALVEDGKPPVMLGEPKGVQAKALADAAGGLAPAK